MSCIKEWHKNLLTLGENYFTQYLVDEGQAFKPLKKASKVIKPYESIMPSINQKQCFRNALLVSLIFDDIDYYEGHYMTNNLGIPLEHAWNVKDGVVIDFTCIKFDVKVDEYFGVKVEKSYLEKYQEGDQYMTALQTWIIKNFTK